MMAGNQNTLNKLETKLDSFDLTTRQTTLQELMALVNASDMHLPPKKEIANLHCHTFFSYNSFADMTSPESKNNGVSLPTQKSSG